MNQQEKAAYSRPKVGLRNIKTALAAALCALIYYFLNRSPAFACIGAIFGMGSSYEQSRLHGGNRFFGTAVGGLSLIHSSCEVTTRWQTRKCLPS